MSTVIRPEIRKTSPYHISKHRYYELKHFCLQYKDWAKEYGNIIFEVDKGLDPTGDKAVRMKVLSKWMEAVDDSAKATDDILGHYIFLAVTENKSYNWLKTVKGIPCCKGVYYDLYRKFWWILSGRRS